MSSVIEINPFHCRMWELHDRLEGQLSEESCKAEIESFFKHGQLIPVLGRPLADDPEHSVELIFGARRLFVARHLNQPLLVDVRELSDLDAIVAMDIENRQRSDISPYERGRSYSRLLRTGYFRSQDELARVLGVSSAQISRLRRIAQLPSVIVDAFDCPTSICEGWGIEIMVALEDPRRRQETIRKARRLAALTPRLAAREVYRELIECGGQFRGVRKHARVHDEIVKGVRGTPLFRLRRYRSNVAVMLPIDKLPGDALERIRSAVAAILEPATAVGANSVARKAQSRKLVAVAE